MFLVFRHGWYGANIDTGGTLLAESTILFYFTNLDIGVHSFQVQWRSSNSVATAYMAAYGGYDMRIFEL